jgi:hypothetical protein
VCEFWVKKVAKSHLEHVACGSPSNTKYQLTSTISTYFFQSTLRVNKKILINLERFNI